MHRSFVQILYSRLGRRLEFYEHPIKRRIYGVNQGYQDANRITRKTDKILGIYNLAIPCEQGSQRSFLYAHTLDCGWKRLNGAVT